MLNGFQPGQVVYVIIRNPHVQGVANVQQAAVVMDPDSSGNLSLFVYETYYPLTGDIAIYQTATEAENAYHEAFGLFDAGMEDFYG